MFPSAKEEACYENNHFSRKKDAGGLRFIAPLGQPEFLERTSILLEYLRGLSYEGLKTLLRCNDSIASLNYERFRNMDLMLGDTPAILAYEGIQYQYMAPEVFSCSQFHYIQKHLRILSGF